MIQKKVRSILVGINTQNICPYIIHGQFWALMKWPKFTKKDITSFYTKNTALAAVLQLRCFSKANQRKPRQRRARHQRAGRRAARRLSSWPPADQHRGTNPGDFVVPIVRAVFVLIYCWVSEAKQDHHYSL